MADEIERAEAELRAAEEALARAVSSDPTDAYIGWEEELERRRARRNELADDYCALVRQAAVSKGLILTHPPADS